MMRTKRILCVLMVGLFVVASSAQSETPYALAWTRQFGTVLGDHARSVTVDVDGNVYITGGTLGDLGGPNAGSTDAFLSKYDASGTLAWTRQLGTNLVDIGRAVAVDTVGNVFITGHTFGDLGGPNAGSADAFLSKYSASGTLAWTRQLGSGSSDNSWGVAVDTEGSAYITGETQGDLGGPNVGGRDVFLSKYDASGTLAWTRQLGTDSQDIGRAVAVDTDDNVYITGWTGGDLGGANAGSSDVFLSKYDASGTLAWTRQLGAGSDDYGVGVAVDTGGSVYITGSTGGDLGGPNAGVYDAILVKYDASGTLAWTRQLGTTRHDGSHGVMVDVDGNVFITGDTQGDLGGRTQRGGARRLSEQVRRLGDASMDPPTGY